MSMYEKRYGLRRGIVEICRRMYSRGYVVATDGNVSVRTGRNTIYVTPSGKCKGMLSPEDIVEVDLDGHRLRGTPRPSSELPMHLAVYRRREDVSAAVHAHPVYSTAFSVSRVQLPACILPEVVVNVGEVALASYATPSTKEVPESLEPLIMDHDAIVLSNHGTLTLGKTLDEAYFRLETVEHFAHIALAAVSLGGVKGLSKSQLRKLALLSGKWDSEMVRCRNCGSCGTGQTDDKLIAKVAETIATELRKQSGK